MFCCIINLSICNGLFQLKKKSSLDKTHVLFWPHPTSFFFIRKAPGSPISLPPILFYPYLNNFCTYHSTKSTLVKVIDLCVAKSLLMLSTHLTQLISSICLSSTVLKKFFSFSSVHDFTIFMLIPSKSGTPGQPLS